MREQPPRRVVIVGQQLSAGGRLAVPRDGVTVLSNATAAAVPGTSAHVAGEPPHIVFIGRLAPGKGIPEGRRGYSIERYVRRLTLEWQAVGWRTSRAGRRANRLPLLADMCRIAQRIR